jgi:hypothetical protein
MASRKSLRRGAQPDGASGKTEGGGGGDRAAADLLAKIAHSHTTTSTRGASSLDLAEDSVSAAKRKKQRTQVPDEPEIITETNEPPPVAPTITKETYPCTYEGCTYVATHRRYITEHMRTHTGCKPYACSWPGCSYTSSGSGHLSALPVPAPPPSELSPASQPRHPTR